jgi:signal peptidase I
LKTYSLSSAAFAALSETLLQAGTAVRFRANGASMLPLIQAGDFLLVKPVAPCQIRVGDVVLFITEEGRPLVHRVIKRQKRAQCYSFLLKADQALEEDGLIAQEEVLGRLESVERAGREISMRSLAYRMLGLGLAWRSRGKLRLTARRGAKSSLLVAKRHARGKGAPLAFKNRDFWV